MKKYLILLFIFLLTGCFGNVGRGELTNTCTKTIKTENLEDITTYEIKFKQDVISEVKLTKYYNGNEDIIKSITKSYESQINLYETKTETEKNNNSYKITYYFSGNVNEKLKDDFYLQNERSKQVKKLEELGFECK